MCAKNSTFSAMFAQFGTIRPQTCSIILLKQKSMGSGKSHPLCSGNKLLLGITGHPDTVCFPESPVMLVFCGMTTHCSSLLVV